MLICMIMIQNRHRCGDYGKSVNFVTLSFMFKTDLRS